MDKEFFANLNRKGIPFPMVRDPKLGVGSITATLMITSSSLCMLCILLVAGAALSKLVHVFDNFAEAQQAFTNAFNLAFQFFLACGGFYLGRKFQRDPSGQLNISGTGQESKGGGDGQDSD